jgi:hypothetical protein
MELAEIPRIMPQFGKTLRNLVRSRSEVFGETKKGSCGGGCGSGGQGPQFGKTLQSLTRTRDEVFGGDEGACGCGCGCGCGGKSGCGGACGGESGRSRLSMLDRPGRTTVAPPMGQFWCRPGSCNVKGQAVSGHIKRARGIEYVCRDSWCEEDCNVCDSQPPRSGGCPDYCKNLYNDTQRICDYYSHHPDLQWLDMCMANKAFYEFWCRTTHSDCPPIAVPEPPIGPIASVPANTCCVALVCRELAGVGGLLFTHCGVMKVDCYGNGKLYEMLNDPPLGLRDYNVLGSKVFAIPTRQNSAYMRQYKVMKQQCFDCQGGESSPCDSVLTDKTVGGYPYKDEYHLPFGVNRSDELLFLAMTLGVGAFFGNEGKNSNSFAHWLASQIWSESELPAPANSMWGWNW